MTPLQAFGKRKRVRLHRKPFKEKASEGRLSDPSYSAFGRKSAATAKPVRGSCVCMRKVAPALVSSVRAKRRNAARARQREREDIRNADLRLCAPRIRLSCAERVWWVFLGLGFVATIITLVLSYMVPVKGPVSCRVGMIPCHHAEVFAYFCIFGSVVYNFF